MKTVAQVLTLPQFLAWARTKPQDETFNYLNGTGHSGAPACPIYQYLTEAGFQDVLVYGGDYSVAGEGSPIPNPIIKGLDRVIKNPGTVFTFGQLVDVLEDELVAGYDKAMASAEPLTLSDM